MTTIKRKCSPYKSAEVQTNISSDKRCTSIAVLSQQGEREQEGDSSEDRHFPYVKLSYFDLKDLGLLSDVSGNVQKQCKLNEKGNSLGEKHLPYVKLSRSDLKDLGLLPGVSENDDKTCKLDNKLGQEQPKRRFFPSPVKKSFSSIRKTRNSTIRRSTIVKKETKKKDLAKVNIFLSNATNENKKHNGKTSNKITDTVKQAEIEISGVRKELFKTAASKPSKKISVNPEGDAFNGKIFETPLIDEDKAEILWKNIPRMQKSIFKSSPISQKFIGSKLITVNKEASCVSPSTSGATNENIPENISLVTLTFEQDEKICEQEQIDHDYSNKIALISDILKKDEEDFQRYNANRKNRINEIYTILNEMIKCTELEVKSEHISEKKINRPETESHSNANDPSKQIEKGTQCSSNLRNAQDLRINVLKTNLDRNCTSKGDRAQNMYNDLRKTFSLLETPKSIKTSDGSKRNISMKLQEQCLLLSETPKH